MVTCLIRWRSSGGRGEFEFVPSDSLDGKSLDLWLEPLGVTMPSEVSGAKVQGKPRLRKRDPDNREKLHLPQLVMAIARLPEPAREDIAGNVAFPLRNKSFVMDEMAFDIIEEDDDTALLAPLRVSIRHAEYQVDLQDRLAAIELDRANLPAIRARHPEYADAIERHLDLVVAGVNTAAIRRAADRVNAIQEGLFGFTNAGSATRLEEADALAPVEEEQEITGREGRILTRIHVYKERDRAFSRRAKDHYRRLSGGRLLCEACGLDPVTIYGPDGERAI